MGEKPGKNRTEMLNWAESDGLGFPGELARHLGKSDRLLDSDEKGVDFSDTLGGRQKLHVVNESGLYTLVLRSNKPGAKEFKRWVTHEVLPSIRKTGGYQAQVAALNVPKSLPEALRLAADLAEKVEVQGQQSAIAAPKAAALDGIWRGSPCRVGTAVSIPPVQYRESILFRQGGHGTGVYKEGRPVGQYLLSPCKHDSRKKASFSDQSESPFGISPWTKTRCPENSWGVSDNFPGRVIFCHPLYRRCHVQDLLDGDSGKVFQAVGVALPPAVREAS